jgi:hypothetical protein
MVAMGRMEGLAATEGEAREVVVAAREALVEMPCLVPSLPWGAWVAMVEEAAEAAAVVPAELEVMGEMVGMAEMGSSSREGASASATNRTGSSARAGSVAVLDWQDSAAQVVLLASGDLEGSAVRAD